MARAPVDYDAISPNYDERYLSNARDGVSAALLYEVLRPYAARQLTLPLTISCYGSAARPLGMLAAAMGDWARAESHFEAALVFDEKLEAPPWLASTQLEYALMLRDRADGRGVEISFYQSDDEGQLVAWIRENPDGVDGWLINAAILTHSSEALASAVSHTDRPFVELHLSNVFAREPFRRRSVIADKAIGVIAGFKANSYLLALDALLDHLA